jgi:nucleoside-diphosphate-sugar epimerase
VSRARHEKRYISRCHVADIVSVLQASMAKPAAGRLYNVVDDDPAPRWEVASFAAALQAGTERHASQLPPVDETRPHGARGDEKRVRNVRIKQELGVTLRFPSYRDGLKHISTTSA